ncbi:beta-galactosidase [bacterium]|nr:beta-galactosidase [bacterium]
MQSNNQIIRFGADYFPEQWPESVWEDDIRLMKQAGVNMVSLAIFSWALLQPDEQTFNFGWLDQIMDLLAGHEIDVCLGTSTAAQPNWLTRKHPDLLFVRENGLQVAPGSRQTFCVNSPVYRDALRKLVRALAEHYAGHSALKLWHINNEYANKNGMCFCRNCETAFQEWLRSRYETLDRLNDAWGTVFWGEKYFKWDEINAPRASSGARNGTKLLDYKRFISESIHGLYTEEVNIFRELTPHIPVTTNFEGDWNKFDHALFRENLDVVSWNSYPNPLDPKARYWAAMRHAMMRSLLGKPFMLMEQAPSQVDWYPVNVSKPPGLMRLWSYQAIAHGSDSVMFFQWRASRKGAEKYHSAMVPHYGEKSRIFSEIVQLGNELKKIREIAGTGIKSRIAILMDNDSWWTVDNPYGSGSKSLDNETFWAANGQPFPSVLIRYFDELQHYFNAFHSLNAAVDVIPAHYDFSKYDIVIAPLLHMVKPGFADAVETFVGSGGTFVATYLSGLVDEYVGVFPEGYPGPLKKVCGIAVEEFDPIQPGSGNRIIMNTGSNGFQKEYHCSVCCEVVHVTEANILACFGNHYYAGYPCITENRYGKGKAYYIATRPDEVFMRDFAKMLFREMCISVRDIPETVEHSIRSHNGQSYEFYLNHGCDEVTIRLPSGQYTDLLTGELCEGILKLEQLGVSILRRMKSNEK